MIFPPIYVGDTPSAYNDLLGVHMPTKMGNGQSWLGVLAQEVFEFRYKWAHLPSYLVGGKTFAQDMEIRSHAVEALVATLFDGRDGDAYFATMLGLLDHPDGYRAKYGYFEGMTRGDINAALQGYIGPAADWVTDHAGFFEDWKAKAPTT